MYLSTDSQPITSTDDPSTRYSWVIDLLYGDENGIFHSVLPEYSLSLDGRTEPSKTVIVEGEIIVAFNNFMCIDMKEIRFLVSDSFLICICSNKSLFQD